MQILKPQRLKKGDLIGIVAPASPIADPSKIDMGVRYLERLGYSVVVGHNATKVHGYLAGTDDERLSDLHEMFSNSRIKAIICLRGGYGSPRLLQRLDYRLIARNPKIVVGYSDITALQLAIWKKCRLVTFHGPMLGVELAGTIDPLTEELFWQTVTSQRRIGLVRLHEKFHPMPLFPGKAGGILLGGNLSIIISMLGTTFQPDFTGSLLFFEEIGEEPYRVDRMLAQIRNASVLGKVKGVLAGQFTDCVPQDPAKPSQSVQEILTELAETLHKPFLSNLPFGHISQKITLPVGLRTSVDATRGVIEYLEPAVG